uniref:Uncharacterized protein n=1 Tax=Tanacetum cinerariifolium TaxID=118510 RepID=A0A699GI64_TANCI|nr:hypothetical protein [Tanacetum cinerariifolium]
MTKSYCLLKQSKVFPVFPSSNKFFQTPHQPSFLKLPINGFHHDLVIGASIELVLGRSRVRLAPSHFYDNIITCHLDHSGGDTWRPDRDDMAVTLAMTWHVAAINTRYRWQRSWAGGQSGDDTWQKRVIQECVSLRSGICRYEEMIGLLEGGTWRAVIGQEGDNMT